MAEFTSTERSRQIVKVSVVGIVTNALLAIFKAAVGLLANSIAIVLDAVNNLSDALSSIITIVGTKLANKAPDRKHPHGYGRLEYLTTVVIAVIVLTAGATSLKESIEHIIHPQTPDYNTVSLVIIGVAVVVKILLGTYFKRRGKTLDSDSLTASGQDALMDSIISISTLVAALIFVFFGLSLEAWLGVIISCFILKAGYEIIKDSTAKLLGERIDGDLSKDIKSTINSVEGVRGTYDLILNDYGPQRLWGSVHVEVDDSLSAAQIDTMTRHIQNEVFTKYQVILHTVGIYSVNTDDVSSKLRSDIYSAITGKHPEVIEIHGFYIIPDTHEIQMDLVISFDAKDRKALQQTIMDELGKQFPDYRFDIIVDSDISD